MPFRFGGTSWPRPRRARRGSPFAPKPFSVAGIPHPLAGLRKRWAAPRLTRIGSEEVKAVLIDRVYEFHVEGVGNLGVG